MMTKNSTEQLFGVIKDVEEEKGYKGLTTESVEVVVNNDDNTIKANVIVDGILGTTIGKAYPAELGVLVANRVEDNTEGIESEINRAIKSEKALSDRLQSVEQFNREDAATKSYVHNAISEATTLSKRVAESVDVTNNTVTIDGEQVSPQVGVLYLVPDYEADGAYLQYTLIDGVLTLIGTTHTDLDDYATIEYVDSRIESIPETDLSDYAKIEDIPDVTGFLKEVPSEYVTEYEFQQSLDTRLTPYATKADLATAISNVGSIKKVIATAVDVANNMVLVDDVWITEIPEDTIYLLEKTDELTSKTYYEEYTLINGTLTLIGTSDADLRGYATEVYVDNSVSAAKQEITSYIQNIKFIDGGTSSQFIQS